MMATPSKKNILQSIENVYDCVLELEQLNRSIPAEESEEW